MPFVIHERNFGYGEQEDWGAADLFTCLMLLIILQMEKTVDINESSRFMKDLELLRAANDESMPSFPEEASPEPSDNGLGSFKFRGDSNPLEQLGLYMKADEEEDEEGEPEPKPQISAPPNDTEEGEID